MIILTLLKVSFYLLLIVVMWVLFALFWGNLGTLINKWKQVDLDIKIVSFFPPILFVVLLIAFDLYDSTEKGYVPLVTLMIQLSAITLASVAAIIAFRNYRRKSGDGLFYAIGSNLPYIPLVILYNIKDKQAFIFAIDVVLSNGIRIRMVDFLSSKEPFILAAFETKMLKLDKVLKYNDQDAAGFSFKNIKEFICITPNGETIAKRLSLPVMTPKHVKENNILRALRVKNKPQNYSRKKIDKKSKYWVYIQEFRLHPDEQYYPVISVFTGYISSNTFYITDESLFEIETNQTRALKEFLLKKVHGQTVNEANYRDHDVRYYGEPSYFVNGLIEQDDYEKIYGPDTNEHPDILLDKIERIIMDNYP